MTSCPDEGKQTSRHCANDLSLLVHCRMNNIINMSK